MRFRVENSYIGYVSESEPKVKASTNALYGLAGEYAVCSELCRRGILALPTPKNNPVYDIAAVHPPTLKTMAIQVKTMSPENSAGWKLAKLPEHEPLSDSLFVVLVRLLPSGSVDFYIFDYPTFRRRVTDVFETYTSQPKRDGTPRKAPDFRWFDLKDMNVSDKDRKDRWDLLGLPIPLFK